MAGYAYHVNKAELIRYMNLQAEDKLRWLARVRKTQTLLPPEIRKLQEIFANYDFMDNRH